VLKNSLRKGPSRGERFIDRRECGNQPMLKRSMTTNKERQKESHYVTYEARTRWRGEKFRGEGGTMRPEGITQSPVEEVKEN